MQLIHYPDEASFNAAIGPHLTADPDANPRLLIAYPPVIEPVFVSDAGYQIFLRADRTRRWLPSGRNTALTTDMAESLSHLPVPDGLSAGQDIARIFADSFVRRGASIKLELGMNYYRLGELVPQRPVAGRARLAQANDMLLLCQLVTDFTREAMGIDRNQTLLQADAADWVKHGRAHFWEADGQVVAMLTLQPNGPGLLRLGAMYVPPHARGHGYSRALIAAVCQQARRAGCDVCLNADREHPFTNQLYQSMGFVLRNIVIDYRFTAPG